MLGFERVRGSARAPEQQVRIDEELQREQHPGDFAVAPPAHLNADGDEQRGESGGPDLVKDADKAVVLPGHGQPLASDFSAWRIPSDTLKPSGSCLSA